MSDFSVNPTVLHLPYGVKSKPRRAIDLDVPVDGGETHSSISLVQYQLLDL
jgi:hypothetical protein